MRNYDKALDLSYFDCRFNEVLCQRSFPHLRAVFEQYKTFSQKDIEDAIKSEFSGDIKNSLLTIGNYTYNSIFYQTR